MAVRWRCRGGCTPAQVRLPAPQPAAQPAAQPPSTPFPPPSLLPPSAVSLLAHAFQQLGRHAIPRQSPGNGERGGGCGAGAGVRRGGLPTRPVGPGPATRQPTPQCPPAHSGRAATTCMASLRPRSAAAPAAAPPRVPPQADRSATSAAAVPAPPPPPPPWTYAARTPLGPASRRAPRRRTTFSRTPAATSATASPKARPDGVGNWASAWEATSPPTGVGAGAPRAAAAAAPARVLNASLRAAKSVSLLI